MTNANAHLSNKFQKSQELRSKLFLENSRVARRTLGVAFDAQMTAQLRVLSLEYRFSIKAGDLQVINDRWYVTHIGLLRLAHRRKCRGIHVEAVDSLCDFASAQYVLKATVYPSKDSSGFVGYGDADPSNVSAVVRGAEMRVAETRAVNRALRKAYGIGVCSVEEIGPNGSPRTTPPPLHESPRSGANGNCGPKVRDRLCQIIRQHKLDPELVKAYAVDFCGTATLKDAAREQVESFVQHLAESARKDRNALICQLNHYSRPAQEATA